MHGCLGGILAASFGIIKLENLIKLQPLIMGCCQILIIYSNGSSGLEGADVLQTDTVTE